MGHQAATLDTNDVRVRGRIICNRKMQLVTSDWDYRAKNGILNGKDFRITEQGKTDSKTEAGKFSIHSPLYGTDIHNEHAYEDRYSCECGNYTGKNFNGRICPECGKKVEYIDIDMSVTGWIILDKDCIINSIFFKKIKSFIGGKIFPDIIKFKELNDRVETPNNPFDGIGCIEFQERFSEIMDFYLKKNASNPKKRDMYYFIMSHFEQVFAHSIPVYSSHLRPFVVRADEIKYTDDDKIFRRIDTNARMLNDKYELERKLNIAKSKNRKKTIQYLRRENILYSIQNDIDKLWDMSFDMIKKKEGTIRDKILGGRLNMSARNVIVPGKHLKADEIELGYTTFLELYKLEIISILTIIHDIPHSKAWSMFDEAKINFNDQIYKIMLFMLKRYKIVCEINRNPTINYGSQLAMKVAHVNPDMTDHCMVLPECILILLNADLTTSGSEVA